MDKKIIIVSFVFLLLILSTSYAVSKENLTREQIISKWNLMYSVYGEKGSCEVVQKESLLNIPQEDRTFPYAKLKEGVNC